ncbi:hypothetical protein AB0K80_26665 [Streptomyces sp. NPDC052682]|uniref:hypothetical protein n=1 Tax=Streptomyces sp. NPDC052682 TaxID=3154954 RepID=UPI003449D1DA
MVFITITVGADQDQDAMLTVKKLRPCAEVVYPAAQLRLSASDGSSSKGKEQLLSDTNWEVARMTFADRDGTVWDRSLNELSIAQPHELTALDISPLRAPQVKQVDQCGS